jgi:hypothetical protein
MSLAPAQSAGLPDRAQPREPKVSAAALRGDSLSLIAANRAARSSEQELYDETFRADAETLAGSALLDPRRAHGGRVQIARIRGHRFRVTGRKKARLSADWRKRYILLYSKNLAGLRI